MATRWLIAVPTEGKSEEETRQHLKQKISRVATVFPVSLPQRMLKVGTLDSLVGISDDLGKMDERLDQLIKRVKRTYVDIFKHDIDGQNDGKQAKRETPTLTVASYRSGGNNAPKQLTPEEYLEHFTWWNRRYNESSTLHALSDKIGKMATLAEIEMKKFVGQYSEVRQKVAAIERIETGSLLVQPLDKYVQQADVTETDMFTTFYVVVPTQKEEHFLAVYDALEDKYKTDRELAAKVKAEEAAAAAEEAELRKRVTADTALLADMSGDEAEAEEGEENAHAIVEEPGVESKGVDNSSSGNGGDNTPQLTERERKMEYALRCTNVIPNSALRLHPRQGEAHTGLAGKGFHEEYLLYRVVVMKKGADLIKKLYREQRFTVREFQFDQKGNAETQKNKVKLLKRRTKLWTFLVNWCKAYYSDLFTAWMHVKAIRVFVEAVLRFGLPVGFCPSIVIPKNEKLARGVLSELYSHLDHADLTGGLENAEFDLSGFGADFHPYVSINIKLPSSETN